jgi:hypothetical protein
MPFWRLCCGGGNSNNELCVMSVSDLKALTLASTIVAEVRLLGITEMGIRKCPRAKHCLV